MNQPAVFRLLSASLAAIRRNLNVINNIIITISVSNLHVANDISVNLIKF